MNICFFSPCAELKSYIDRYWSWDNTQKQNEIYMPVISPARALNFLFITKIRFSLIIQEN